MQFGAIRNRRSLIGVDNLAALLRTCLLHDAAAGEVFLASDQEDVSTPELVRRIARAQGREARLVSLPPVALRGLAALSGNRDVGERLCGSLVVDSSKATELLGWEPRVPMLEQLRRIDGSVATRRAS